jgi:hypothetical protein
VARAGNGLIGNSTNALMAEQPDVDIGGLDELLPTQMSFRETLWIKQLTVPQDWDANC